MQKYIQLFSKMIDEHQISFLPLHSIKEGKCTCGSLNCISPGKHPRLRKSWKKIASSDKSKLNEWQQKFGETLNLGVCTGQLPNGKHLVVLDFDTKEHSLISKLPKTFNYKTGSGGHHFWFISAKSVNNSISSLAEKVDVRGAGGYVVVPPSRHHSGGFYHFHDDSHHEIAELPEWFFDERSKKSGSIIRQGTGKQNKPLAHHWSGLSIPEIRIRLDSGILIPNGARNTTIHRLLSSDRAKGCLFKSDMWQKALAYRSLCEESKTVTDNELSHIVSSAMKYEPYNNYEPSKVLEVYIKFMNKKEERVNESWVQKLDQHFFNCIKKDTGTFVTLSFIMNEYEKFFKYHGVPRPPRYKSQLFAKKIRDLGFERKRTSSGNLWGAFLEITSPMVYAESNDTPPERTELMSEETSENVAEMSAEKPKPQRGDPDEIVMIRDKVTIKNKKHPNDEKYAYFRTTYEYNKAFNEKTLELSDDELAQLASGNLVQNAQATQELYDSMEIDDLVGIGYEKFFVREKDGQSVTVEQCVSHDEKTFSFGELDFERELGYAEVLYRKEDGEYKIVGEREVQKDVIYHLYRKDLKPGQEDKIWYPEDEEQGEGEETPEE